MWILVCCDVGAYHTKRKGPRQTLGWIVICPSFLNIRSNKLQQTFKSFRQHSDIRYAFFCITQNLIKKMMLFPKFISFFKYAVGPNKFSALSSFINPKQEHQQGLLCSVAVRVVTTIEATPCDHERGASRVKKHAAFVSLTFYAHSIVVRHENDSKSDALSSQV